MNKNIFISAVLASALGTTGCGSDLGTEEITVPLTYLDGESNAGPTDATGTATIDPVTGLVEIDVVGLTPIADTVYEGWLAGNLTTPISTGRFTTDADGVGSSSITLGNITEDNYGKVVLTIEPEPDPDPGPDPRHSLVGLIESE